MPKHNNIHNIVCQYLAVLYSRRRRIILIGFDFRKSKTFYLLRKPISVYLDSSHVCSYRNRYFCGNEKATFHLYLFNTVQRYSINHATHFSSKFTQNPTEQRALCKARLVVYCLHFRLDFRSRTVKRDSFSSARFISVQRQSGHRVLAEICMT